LSGPVFDIEGNMSSSTFAAGDSRGEFASEPLSAEQAAIDEHLLQNVLNQTLAAMDEGQAVDDAERQALQTVVERYPDSELCLEPIGEQLVSAMLAARFRCLEYPPEVWENLAPQIARTLWEDPTSRARLLELWTRLNEASG
jgi:hypothetical protein